MRTVIFTGGIMRSSARVDDAIRKAELIIAADGGADSALSVKCTPHIAVGDFDSIHHETLAMLEKKACEIVRHNNEKDETDTEIAINHALARGATSIDIIGGIEGDRIDHILANISLATICPVPLRFLSGKTIAWAVKGPADVAIEGKAGDLLSLIPLCEDVSGITTEYLKYALTEDTLKVGKPRGISNVLEKDSVKVKFSSGSLFIVHIAS